MPIIIAARLDFNPRVTGYNEQAQPDTNWVAQEGVTATTTVFWRPEERSVKYFLEYDFWEWDGDVGPRDRRDDRIKYAQHMVLNPPLEGIVPYVLQMPRHDNWDQESKGDEIYAVAHLFPEEGQSVQIYVPGDGPRTMPPEQTLAYTNRVDRWW